MAKEIVFTIDKDTGGVTIEAKGYKGPECKAATAPYEKLFGTPENDTPTPEMGARTVEHVKQTQG
jgi:Protein of unknown function (DUF2997)